MACSVDAASKKLKMSENRRGGRYCVAGGPNQQSCMNSTYKEGISMHQFPKDPQIRIQWEKFVQRHRKDFKATSQYTSLCSVHFEESCYEFPMQLEGIKMTKKLKKGSIPTIDAVNIAKQPTISARRKRQVSFYCFSVLANLFDIGIRLCIMYTIR